MSTTIIVHEKIENCETQVNSQCTQCNAGYHVNPNGTCSPNCPQISNCETCDDSQNQWRCDKCMPGFFPSPVGFGFSCTKHPFCGVGCETCSESSSGGGITCASCKSGYSLQKDGTCKEKLPYWFWIIVGGGGALLLSLILYFSLRKGQTQEEWAQSIRNRVK